MRLELRVFDNSEREILTVCGENDLIFEFAKKLLELYAPARASICPKQPNKASPVDLEAK